MRKHLSMLLALALLVTGAFGLAGPATAHPVTVGPQGDLDGEWNNFAVTASRFSEKNVGRILRNTQSQGEYAWRDVSGTDAAPTATDARLVLTETRQIDLDQFRLTGTPTDLYIYAEFAGLTDLSGGAVPELQVAIDVPGVNTAGNDRFVANPVRPATTVTPTIATNWDYLVRTRFDEPLTVDLLNKLNRNAPVVYTALNGAGAPQGEGVLSTLTNAIELRIPWTALGTAGPRPNLRFYVATLRSDHLAAQTDSGFGSAVLDVISRDTDNVAGDSAEDTVAAFSQDLGGGNEGLDYSFEVNFNATSGEPYSPVLITELSLRPAETGLSPLNQAQWVEISNLSGAPLDITDYKFGDAGDPTSSEGMYSLSNVSGNVGVDQSIIVTRNRVAFGNLYPTAQFPAVDLDNVYEAITTTGTLKLTPYPGWASDDFSLPVKPNIATPTVLRDQAVLLNADDTIVDLVEYVLEGTPNTSWYPENVPVTVQATDPAKPGDQNQNPSVAGNVGFVRCPALRDTNNAPIDFALVTTKEAHTPLSIGCSVVDLYTSVAGPGGVVVDAVNPTTHNYTVTYSNNRANALNATVVVTLPRAMSLAGATTSTPDIGQPTVGATGDGRVLLTWSNVSSAFATPGTINLALSLPGGINPEPATNLQATISPAVGINDSNPANNSTVYPITYSSQPFADVGIAITNKNADEFFPGGQIVYGVTVTNGGPQQADNVTIEIDAPSFLGYKSNTQGYPATVSGTKVTLTVGTVPAGFPTVSSILVDVVFTVNANATVGATAQATAVVKTTTTPETPTTNNTAATTVIAVQERPDAPNITITKARKDSNAVKQGDLVTYVLTVSNTGTRPAPAGEVIINDDFPEDQLEYISHSTTADVGELPLGTLVRYTLRSILTPGQTITIEAVFQVRSSVPNNTQVVNEVNVPRITDESTDVDNSSDAVLTVSPVVIGNDYKVLLPIVVR